MVYVTCDISCILSRSRARMSDSRDCRVGVMTRSVSRAMARISADMRGAVPCDGGGVRVRVCVGLDACVETEGYELNSCVDVDVDVAELGSV